MRTVVIGAGLSGLFAAIRLARAGERVTLVTKGLGGLQLSQGAIDVLGYVDGERVDDPWASFDRLAADHPYRLLGAEEVRAAALELQSWLPDLLVGDAARNRLHPTAVGAMRPTTLVQPSMLAGDCRPDARFVIVGVRQLKDLHPELIAGNLARTDLPEGGRLQARAAWVDLAARPGEVDASNVTYARALDTERGREHFAAALRGVARDGEHIGVPAVVGLNDPEAFADLQRRVGQPVFEIVMQPPSVPGMRLNQALTALAREAGVRIVLGSPVVGLETAEGRATGVRVKVAGRTQTIACEHVVHAPGGFESGALAMDSYGTITETALGLPLVGTDADDLVHGDYWGRPQGLFRVGVAVDESMRVLDGGRPLHPNVHAAGGILAGAMRWTELSGEGIALGSARRATEAILDSRKGA